MQVWPERALIMFEQGAKSLLKTVSVMFFYIPTFKRLISGDWFTCKTLYYPISYFYMNQLFELSYFFIKKMF